MLAHLDSGYSLALYYIDKLNKLSSDSTLKHMSIYILSEYTDISIRLSDSSLTTYLCTAASVSKNSRFLLRLNGAR